ncbi:MAG: metal-dependent hydrolase [Acidobacteria bacterium]|nr:metal-dependent hydrolase [Acidobacteriota bacterium]
MDNLTHTLTGLLLSRAGFNRLTPNASLLMMVAANVPDIDIVATAGGSLVYLEYHRHLTHAVAAAPLMALAGVAITRFVLRRAVPWIPGLMAASAAVASHLLLDWTNTYGIRLGLPFSDRWFALGWTNVVDFLLWTVLLFAAGWPLLSRLVSQEIGAKSTPGRGLAILGLCFAALSNYGRGVAQGRAEDLLASRLYAGQTPVRVAAWPDPVNPLRWLGLVETAGAFHCTPVNLASEFDPEDGVALYKAPSSPALEAARRTATFEKFLAFSTVTLWTVLPPPSGEPGYLVEARDLRFGCREPRFRARVEFDPALRVRREWFEFGPPASSLQRK